MEATVDVCGIKDQRKGIKLGGDLRLRGKELRAVGP